MNNKNENQRMDEGEDDGAGNQGKQKRQRTARIIPSTIPPGLKMVRYRLAVGQRQGVTSEELKKLLIEESGVDKKNIFNINIQHDFTLVELPDEMPQDIFMHLKSVEIHQQKLEIKRLKVRNKKRGTIHTRRGKRQRVRTGEKAVRHSV